jgi:hypothetical protein
MSCPMTSEDPRLPSPAWQGPEPLVPPRRLGRLLAEARVACGMSVVDASSAVAVPLNRYEVLDIEVGRRGVSELELRALALLYGIEVSDVVPPRCRLVVDLQEGCIDAGADGARVPSGARRREVLSRYLGLVYAMRGESPGTVVPLRFDDVEVLAAALDWDHLGVEQELRALMRAAAGPLRTRVAGLRGRLVVPLAGIVVAATAAGTLVLVPADDSAAEDGPAPAEIGVAVVQERLPDGTPGPIVVRD